VTNRYLLKTAIVRLCFQHKALQLISECAEKLILPQEFKYLTITINMQCTTLHLPIYKQLCISYLSKNENTVIHQDFCTTVETCLTMLSFNFYFVTEEHILSAHQH